MSEKQPEKKVGFFAKAKRSSKASLNELKKVHYKKRADYLYKCGTGNSRSDCGSDLDCRFCCR